MQDRAGGGHARDGVVRLEEQFGQLVAHATVASGQGRPSVTAIVRSSFASRLRIQGARQEHAARLLRAERAVVDDAPAAQPDIGHAADHRPAVPQ